MDDKRIIENLKIIISSVVEESAMDGAINDSEDGRRIIIGYSIDELKDDLLKAVTNTLVLCKVLNKENLK